MNSTYQKKILKLVHFLSFSYNFLSTKQKLKQKGLKVQNYLPTLPWILTQKLRLLSPKPFQLTPTFADPFLSSPHKLTHLHIGIFQANPISFFPDSSSFDHNRSEPHWTDRVKLSHENPSDPFGFAEARTRKLGLWWEFLDLGFLRSLKRVRV